MQNFCASTVALSRDKRSLVVRDSVAPADDFSFPSAYREHPWNHHFRDMAAPVFWAWVVLEGYEAGCGPGATRDAMGMAKRDSGSAGAQRRGDDRAGGRRAGKARLSRGVFHRDRGRS